MHHSWPSNSVARLFILQNALALTSLKITFVVRKRTSNDVESAAANRYPSQKGGEKTPWRRLEICIGSLHDSSDGVVFGDVDCFCVERKSAQKHCGILPHPATGFDGWRCASRK